VYQGKRYVDMNYKHIAVPRLIVLILLLLFILTPGQPEPSKSTPAQVIHRTYPLTDERWTEVTATGYCKCIVCCEKISENAVTYSGQIARSSRTIAANLSFYPIGTRLYIKDLGIRVVEDTGGALHNKDIDIYFNTHNEALQFGRQTILIKEIL